MRYYLHYQRDVLCQEIYGPIQEEPVNLVNNADVIRHQLAMDYETWLRNRTGSSKLAGKTIEDNLNLAKALFFAPPDDQLKVTDIPNPTVVQMIQNYFLENQSAKITLPLDKVSSIFKFTLSWLSKNYDLGPNADNFIECFLNTSDLQGALVRLYLFHPTICIPDTLAVLYDRFSEIGIQFVCGQELESILCNHFRLSWYPYNLTRFQKFMECIASVSDIPPDKGREKFVMPAMGDDLNIRYHVVEPIEPSYIELLERCFFSDTNSVVLSNTPVNQTQLLDQIYRFSDIPYSENRVIRLANKIIHFAGRLSIISKAEALTALKSIRTTKVISPRVKFQLMESGIDINQGLRVTP